MKPLEIIFIVVLLLFGIIGGLVDTYTSFRFFPPKKEPAEWFSNYFLVWWLIIFVVGLPFLLAYVASGFSSWVIRVYITFGVLASVLWDLAFSKLWSGKWISDSCLTWFWIGKHTIGFTSKTVVRLHIFRLILFCILSYIFYAPVR